MPHPQISPVAWTSYPNKFNIHVPIDTHGLMAALNVCTCTVKPLNKGHFGTRPT